MLFWHSELKLFDILKKSIKDVFKNIKEIFKLTWVELILAIFAVLLSSKMNHYFYKEIYLSFLTKSASSFIKGSLIGILSTMLFSFFFFAAFAKAVNFFLNEKKIKKNKLYRITIPEIKFIEKGFFAFSIILILETILSPLLGIMFGMLAGSGIITLKTANYLIITMFPILVVLFSAFLFLYYIKLAYIYEDKNIKLKKFLKELKGHKGKIIIGYILIYIIPVVLICAPFYYPYIKEAGSFEAFINRISQYATYFKINYAANTALGICTYVINIVYASYLVRCYKKIN